MGIGNVQIEFSSQTRQGSDEMDDGLHEGGQVAGEPRCGAQAVRGLLGMLHAHYEAGASVFQGFHGRRLSDVAGDGQIGRPLPL